MTLRLWCRFCLFGCLLILLCYPLSAAIVINEVYYDHPGTDTGYEWLELYNNGTENVQLEGAKIQAAGSVWTDKFTFPAFVLRPGRYLLIGEAQVANTQFTAELRFENGDTATDGVRYVSPDGLYTDTVLYHPNNLNGLTDDNGVIATSMAPDVQAGSSLARVANGVDSNLCAQDFCAENSPSPGLPNPHRCDYALLYPSLSYANGIAEISLWIKNKSSISPLIPAELKVSQSGEAIYQMDISPIAAQDSLMVDIQLVCAALPLLIELSLIGDPNTTNNSLSLSLGGSTTNSLYINEFMAYPASGNQEWMELYSPGNAGTKGLSEYKITDSSNGNIRFLLPASAGYYVVCQDTAALKLSYPQCPSSSLISALSWTYLNNDGDLLLLRQGDATLDSLSYLEDELIRGVSRERYLNANDQISWQNCYYAIGASPGEQNSSPVQISLPDAGSIALSGSPCKPNAGERISIAYNLLAESNVISCNVFDLRGKKQISLANNSPAGKSGALYWDGRKQDGSLAPRGLYYIVWESNAQGGGQKLRKQLSAVISR